MLASVAASRSAHLKSTGHTAASALTGGYHVAFVIGALFAVAAAAIGATLLRTQVAPAHEPEPSPA